DLAENNLGFADAELEPFATHVLDQNAEMHHAAARDAELFLRRARCNAESNVRAEFLFESFAKLPAGEEFAVPPAEGTVVHSEHHMERRLIDPRVRKRLGMVGVGDRVADFDRFKTDDGAEVARF